MLIQARLHVIPVGIYLGTSGDGRFTSPSNFAQRVEQRLRDHHVPCAIRVYGFRAERLRITMLQMGLEHIVQSHESRLVAIAHPLDGRDVFGNEKLAR